MKTIEEKAKAYDEAMKQAIEIYDASNEDGKLALEMIFPELAESEDERIRIAIINLVNTEFGDRFPFDGFTREQMLAWLERQGEHTNFRNKIQVGDKITRNEDGVLVNLSQLKRVAKPADKEQKPAWSEEDETVLNNLIYALANDRIGNSRDEYVNWLKYIKDRVVPQTKQEWSKDDMERYESCLNRLGTGNPAQPETINSKWFKEHVNPQKQWKPSEEQILAINTAINVVGKGTLSGKHLIEILEQLKAL